MIIFFYKIYSLCKNIAISKVLNKLQVFHFRSTVHTNTTPTVMTHSCVLQKPPFCHDNGYKFELNRRVSPLKIEKQKKKVIRANFKLFHLYFATFLVGNIMLSAIF